eukprot:g2143.t1
MIRRQAALDASMLGSKSDESSATSKVGEEEGKATKFACGEPEILKIALKPNGWKANTRYKKLSSVWGTMRKKIIYCIVKAENWDLLLFSIEQHEQEKEELCKFAAESMKELQKEGSLQARELLQGFLEKTDGEGNTELMQAAEKGAAETVSSLLDEGSFVDNKNKQGNTALMLAAKNGHLKVVNTLLDKGANVNEQNMKGNTALTLAAENDCFEVVKTLLKNPKILAKNGEFKSGRMVAAKTALMFAADAETHNLDILQSLLVNFRSLLNNGVVHSSDTQEALQILLMKMDEEMTNGTIKISRDDTFTQTKVPTREKLFVQVIMELVRSLEYGEFEADANGTSIKNLFAGEKLSQVYEFQLFVCIHFMGAELKASDCVNFARGKEKKKNS